MAVAINKVPEADYVVSNKRLVVRDLALTGNYPAGGEVITPEDVGLGTIEQVYLHGGAGEVDLTGAWITKVDYQANGSVKIALFEGSGAGLVPTQKPAEAYESASELRATFVGR